MKIYFCPCYLRFHCILPMNMWEVNEIYFHFKYPYPFNRHCAISCKNKPSDSFSFTPEHPVIQSVVPRHNFRCRSNYILHWRLLCLLKVSIVPIDLLQNRKFRLIITIKIYISKPLIRLEE